MVLYIMCNYADITDCYFYLVVSCVEQVPSVFCLWLGLWLLSSGPEEDRFFLASRSVEGVITVNSTNNCWVHFAYYNSIRFGTSPAPPRKLRAGGQSL